MNCPACNIEIDPVQASTDVLVLAPGVEGRRITRFTKCACGAELQLGAWEGWERWYIKSWRKTNLQGGRNKSDESNAYYERERFHQRGAVAN